MIDWENLLDLSRSVYLFSRHRIIHNIFVAILVKCLPLNGVNGVWEKIIEIIIVTCWSAVF